jgi:signal transduction histidine kinase
VVIDDLVGYRGQVAEVATDPHLAASLRALAAFALAKAHTADEQAAGYAALSSGALDPQQYGAFLATLSGRDSALRDFDLNATDGQRALVGSTVTGDAVRIADQVAEQMGRSVGRSTPLVTPGALAAAIGAVVDLMRRAEQQLDTGATGDARAAQAAVVQDVAIESALVVVTIVLALVVAFFLARALSRALSRLREGAMAVVGRELPNAVARLRDIGEGGLTSPDEIVAQLRDPVRIDSRDEIGQVAQAFNAVHREAVRVAAEQAALRTSVSAMFLNLARRSQALVDRMIGELDTIERGEEDPKRLAQLFQLDHLATRMRRNDENLLVLAGADSASPRRDHALVADVLRAAQSEVEHYARIEFGTVDLDVSVVSHAVNDVVRLLAELFDNATRFSPPETTVLVDGRRIGDYVVIQVEDRGLGMAEEQMRLLNERLAEPPTVDVTVFRMMGLAVVSRLASRCRIKVELSANPEGGTITSVTLPTSVLVLPRLRGREPLITRPRTAVAGAPIAGAPIVAEPVLPASAAGGGAAAVAGWPMPQLPGLAGNPAPVPAGVLTVDALGLPTGSHATVLADQTTEMPIFQAMEAMWFRGTDEADQGSGPGGPDPGPVPGSGRAAASGNGRSDGASGAPRMPSGAARPAVPPAPPGPQDDSWRTVADDGWRAAAAAAQPTAAGTTRSGLPKRVPAAQLVPGAVDGRTTDAHAKRTPDNVRGLLSAYHRGVQRGRSGGGRPESEETH